MLNVNFEAMKDRIEEIVREYGIDIENEAEFIEKLLNLHSVIKIKPLSKYCDIKFHNECDCGKYCTG